MCTIQASDVLVGTMWVMRALPSQVISVVALVSIPRMLVSVLNASPTFTGVQGGNADLRRIRPGNRFRVKQDSAQPEGRHVRALPAGSTGDHPAGGQIRFHEDIALKRDPCGVAGRLRNICVCVCEREPARESKGRADGHIIGIDYLDGKIGGIKHQLQIVEVSEIVLESTIVDQVCIGNPFLQ